MLPTDLQRKINEVVKTAEIKNIRTSNGFIEVQCEFEDGVFSPFMPYCMPFVGGTSIFCYPQVGQGGIIISEGGENEINRFLPVIDTQAKLAGLGAFDFMILFENGDSIHHKSGNLTINSKSTVVINTDSATVNAKSVTSNGNKMTVNADSIDLNGNVKVTGSFSQAPGESGGGTATFTSPADFKANVKIKGIDFSTHKHDTPSGMSGTPV